MAAHIFAQSPIGCNAFLGGILKNYGSNLILSDHSDLTVIEADEYDRSFHQLSPYMAVITAADPDHLDIYGNEDAYLESFRYFTTLIRSGGVLIIKKGIKIIRMKSKPASHPLKNFIRRKKSVSFFNPTSTRVPGILLHNLQKHCLLRTN